MEVAKSTKDVTILLENTAGQKNSVGSDFTQLAEIFFSLEPADRFGICIDTCHAFAAGYDLKNQKNVKDTFEKFDLKAFKPKKQYYLNYVLRVSMRANWSSCFHFRFYS